MKIISGAESGGKKNLFFCLLYKICAILKHIQSLYLFLMTYCLIYSPISFSYDIK